MGTGITTGHFVRDVVAYKSGINLLSKSRVRRMVRARQIAMYLMRQHTTLSMPQIARIFKLKDHTTVLHAQRVIPRYSECEPKTKHLLYSCDLMIKTAYSVISEGESVSGD